MRLEIKSQHMLDNERQLEVEIHRDSNETLGPIRKLDERLRVFDPI
jgi:hypothetical protein